MENSNPMEATITEPTEKKVRKGVSQWNIAWRRFKKNRAALAGLIVIGVVVFMALFGPIIARYPPNYLASLREEGRIRMPPSTKYLFGTDYVGHDVFSQVVYGASAALYVGFGSAAIAMSLAIVIGLVSGYYGGLLDNLLMRITEVFLVIPFLLFFIPVSLLIVPLFLFVIPLLLLGAPLLLSFSADAALTDATVTDSTKQTASKIPSVFLFCKMFSFPLCLLLNFV